MSLAHKVLNDVNFFANCKLKRSFTTVKQFVYLSILWLSAIGLQPVAAQEVIQGLVFDKNTKQRVSRVFIYNPSNDAGGYNNTKGEFEIQAKAGDVLIAAANGYYADTLRIADESVVVFQLERSTILIDEVSVIARRSPEERLAENQREYSTAYSRGTPGPIFSVAPTGAGVSIDALYKLISREGRNARRLQEIIEQDYRESVIDYRFTPELVSRATGLTGDPLRDFMRQYRPSYFFVLNANDYNLVYYIRSSYAQYRERPSLRRLPPLPKLEDIIEDPE